MENLWTDDSDSELDQQIEQLVLDPRFRAWVLNPTPESEEYWTEYQFLQPDREKAVRQARALVVTLQMPDYALSDEAIAARTERLLHRIRSQQNSQPVITRLLHSQVWRWAAVLLLICGISWWGYDKLTQQPADRAAHQTDERPNLPDVSVGTVTEEMSGSTERRIILPDRSTVTLAPHSYLRYAQSFGQVDRTVALTGQAFFSVIRNPRKPFFVFTDALVTRVLGTSFTVKNRAGQPATVIVRTGQVSVYARRNFQDGSKEGSAGLILTPNQQATLRPTDNGLARSLVETPLPLPTEATSTLDFEDRPVSEVIEALVKTYGVPIAYDKERLSRCRVTVTLEKEPLFDQLALLSKLIDGHYEVVDAQVYLYAQGCE